MAYKIVSVIFGVCVFGSVCKAQEWPRRVDIDDLKLDIKTMKGQLIRVSGVLQVFGGMAMLKDKPFDMSPIMINTSDLPRNDRKRILESCSTLCKTTLTARVDTSAFGEPGLEAVSLEAVEETGLF